MKVHLLKPINDVYYTIQPSLGLGYVASIFLRHGHEVSILHAGRERMSWAGFEELLRRERPDCIGFQMMTHEFSSVQRHMQIIRERLPEALTLLGGPHISGDPLGTMRAMPQADFGFVSEAEAGLDHFLKLTAAERADPDALSQVPNLVWRRGEEVVINPARKFKNLDDIEFPAWHLMPPASYPVAPHGNFCRRPPVAPIITSRGCPYWCTFCAGHRMTGRDVRFRSPENVMAEISLLHHQYGVREFHIEDEVFTFKKSYIKEICNRILDAKMDLALALPNGVRLDSLDEEILCLLEKTGFYSMGVGIESGSDRVLKLMNKHLNKEIIRRQVDLIKRCTRIHLTGFFIIGYPTETEAEILETIEFAKSLRIDKANFMFLSPLPGSQIWEEYRKTHAEEPNWANTFSYRVTEGMADLPVEKIRKLHRKAIWEFYFRPRILFGLLKQIKSFDQIKFLTSRLTSIFG